jgi:holliday junction DNA helicase RuvA
MITHLEGVLVDKQPANIVLDVNGVGYEVFISLSTYDRLPPKGERCRVLTWDYLREDAHQLFGFITEAERRMFTLLLTINGIGPKLALRALSGLSVREMRAAIVQGDVKRLSSISGIGKKTAERIVVDLRDKIAAGEAFEAVSGAQGPTPEDMRLRDSVLALIALGYQQATARKTVAAIVEKAPEGSLTVEEIVKQALQE